MITFTTEYLMNTLYKLQGTKAPASKEEQATVFATMAVKELRCVLVDGEEAAALWKEAKEWYLADPEQEEI